MKILFVINNMYVRGNGLDAATRRTVHELKAAGEDVRVLSGCDPTKPGQHPEFPLKEFKFHNGNPDDEFVGMRYRFSNPCLYMHKDTPEYHCI